MFDEAAAITLEAWVREGGALIIAGDSGTRRGERENFEHAAHGSTLAALIGNPPAVAAKPRSLGKGTVLYLREDPGLPFYLADAERGALLDEFRRALSSIKVTPEHLSLDATNVPASVGLTLYHDGERFFVDVNNTDIDVGQDRLTPAAPLAFTVALPPELRGKQLHARVLSPDALPGVQLNTIDAGHVRIQLGAVPVYASVMVTVGLPGSAKQHSSK